MIWLSTTCHTSSPISLFLTSSLATPKSCQLSSTSGSFHWLFPLTGVIFLPDVHTAGSPQAFTQKLPLSLFPMPIHLNISHPPFCVSSLSLFSAVRCQTSFIPDLLMNSLSLPAECNFTEGTFSSCLHFCTSALWPLYLHLSNKYLNAKHIPIKIRYHFALS